MRTIREILKNTGYNERELELFPAKCCFDYPYFAEHVFGFEIADYHREWFYLAEKYKRLSITAFRGSGKTSWFAGYFIWKAIFNRNLNFLIISFNFEQSKLVLKIIRRMFNDNELLRQFMPDTRESSWKATELTIKNGCTFYCRTYGEGVRGLRIDYLLCDEAGRYEDKSIFWTAVSPVVQLNRGSIVVIGTPRSSIDLLAELKENDEYMCYEYPIEKNGRVLWPQKYTLKKEDEEGKRSLHGIKKEVGELAYTQEYMLIPISSANSLFPYELTSKALNDSIGFLPYGKTGNRYYIGCDLSITTKGDFTVFTVLEANADRKTIVKALRFRDTHEEQKRRLIKLYEDFRPIKIVVDKTGLGEIFFRELKQLIPNVEPLHFTYDEKWKLIMDLRQEFERFNIEIPCSKKDIKAYSYSQQLLKELNDFTLKVDTKHTKSGVKFSSGEYDDCVISLALANRASQNIYGNVSIRCI